MQHHIRNALPADAAIITDIVRQSFQDVALRFGLTIDNCPRHPSNCQVKWIDDAMRKGVAFFILEVEHRPVGTIALEQASAEVGYIERLGVLPAHRRQGFGHLLVEHALSRARQRRLKQIDIGIIGAQTELQRWYERFGFAAIRRAVFDHLPFEVLFMSRSI